MLSWVLLVKVTVHKLKDLKAISTPMVSAMLVKRWMSSRWLIVFVPTTWSSVVPKYLFDLAPVLSTVPQSGVDFHLWLTVPSGIWNLDKSPSPCPLILFLWNIEILYFSSYCHVCNVCLPEATGGYGSVRSVFCVSEISPRWGTETRMRMAWWRCWWHDDPGYWWMVWWVFLRYSSRANAFALTTVVCKCGYIKRTHEPEKIMGISKSCEGRSTSSKW